MGPSENRGFIPLSWPPNLSASYPPFHFLFNFYSTPAPGDLVYIVTILQYETIQLLPDRRGGRPEGSLSLRSHGGGTPPLLAPGRVTSPRHILGV
jgi:hypothetical protein